MQQLRFVPEDPQIKEKVGQFIKVVRSKAMSDSLFLPQTDKQTTKLAIQVNERIVNKNNRKYVLMAIFGFQFPSMKNLTRHCVSVLIDELENNKDTWQILQKIEEMVNVQIDGGFPPKPWELFALEKAND